jgi:xanthine dehydrogenase accessory factor
MVVDDAETAKEENFPGVTLINDPYPDSLKKVDIRPSDYVAVFHGETPFELAALRHAAKARPAYIGLLGSANKARKHKEQLKKEGLDGKVLDAIHGPIGLDINAETPEEISISIVAEIIQKKRG